MFRADILECLQRGDYPSRLLPRKRCPLSASTADTRFSGDIHIHAYGHVQFTRVTSDGRRQLADFTLPYGKFLRRDTRRMPTISQVAARRKAPGLEPPAHSGIWGFWTGLGEK